MSIHGKVIPITAVEFDSSGNPTKYQTDPSKTVVPDTSTVNEYKIATRSNIKKGDIVRVYSSPKGVSIFSKSIGEIDFKLLFKVTPDIDARFNNFNFIPVGIQVNVDPEEKLSPNDEYDTNMIKNLKVTTISTSELSTHGSFTDISVDADKIKSMKPADAPEDEFTINSEGVVMAKDHGTDSWKTNRLFFDRKYKSLEFTVVRDGQWIILSGDEVGNMVVAGIFTSDENNGKITIVKNNTIDQKIGIIDADAIHRKFVNTSDNTDYIAWAQKSSMPIKIGDRIKVVLLDTHRAGVYKYNSIADEFEHLFTISTELNGRLINTSFDRLGMAINISRFENKGLQFAKDINLTISENPYKYDFTPDEDEVYNVYGIIGGHEACGRIRDRVDLTEFQKSNKILQLTKDMRIQPIAYMADSTIYHGSQAAAYENTYNSQSPDRKGYISPARLISQALLKGDPLRSVISVTVAKGNSGLSTGIEAESNDSTYDHKLKRPVDCNTPYKWTVNSPYWKTFKDRVDYVMNKFPTARFCGVFYFGDDGTAPFFLGTPESEQAFNTYKANAEAIATDLQAWIKNSSWSERTIWPNDSYSLIIPYIIYGGNGKEKYFKDNFYYRNSPTLNHKLLTEFYNVSDHNIKFAGTFNGDVLTNNEKFANLAFWKNNAEGIKNAMIRNQLILGPETKELLKKYTPGDANARFLSDLRGWDWACGYMDDAREAVQNAFYCKSGAGGVRPFLLSTQDVLCKNIDDTWFILKANPEHAKPENYGIRTTISGSFTIRNPWFPGAVDENKTKVIDGGKFGSVYTQSYYVPGSPEKPENRRLKVIFGIRPMNVSRLSAGGVTYTNSEGRNVPVIPDTFIPDKDILTIITKIVAPDGRITHRIKWKGEHKSLLASGKNPNTQVKSEPWMCAKVEASDVIPGSIVYVTYANKYLKYINQKSVTLK